MDRITEKIFTLLKEVTDCCNRNGIPYFLSSELTKWALCGGQLPDNLGMMEIHIHSNQMKELGYQLARLDPENREVESLRTNSDFIHTGLIYVDRNSTFLMLEYARNIQAPGLGVQITPIIPNVGSRLKNRIMKERIFLPILLNRRACGVLPLSWKKRRYLDICSLFAPLFGKKRLAEQAMQFPEATHYNTVFILNESLSRKSYQAYHFNTCSTVQLCGVNFSAVYDAEIFMWACFGENWRANVSKEVKYQDSVLLFPNFPYQQVQSVISDKEVSVVQKVHAWLDVNEKKRRRLLKRISMQKNYFFRTANRFKMKDIYENKLPECRAAYNARDWEKLGTLLAPYLEISQWARKNDIPFAFEAAYYDLLLNWLLYNDSIASVKANSSLARWMYQERATALQYLQRVDSSRLA